MSYVMVTIDPETNHFYTINELFACRVCLSTGDKLFNLHEFKLTKMFEDLTGTPVSPTDGLPQHICTICYSLLRKSAAFRAKCRQTHIFLQDARIKQPSITTEYISNIRNMLPNSTFKLFKTNTLVIDFPSPTETNLEMDNQESVIIDVDTDNEEEITPDIHGTPTQLLVPVNNNTDNNLQVFYPSTATEEITEYTSKCKQTRFKLKRKSTDRPSPLKVDEKNAKMCISRDNCTHEYIFQGNFKSLPKTEVGDHINLDLIQDPLTCHQEFTIDNPTGFQLQEFTELTPENTNDDYDEIVLITESNPDEDALEDTTILHEEFIIKEESY